MKSNKFVEELKTKSDAELAQELVAAKKELFNLRFQNATNQLILQESKKLEETLHVFRLLSPRRLERNAWVRRKEIKPWKEI